MQQKTNRGVVYVGPGKVEVHNIPYLTFEHPWYYLKSTKSPINHPLGTNHADVSTQWLSSALPRTYAGVTSTCNVPHYKCTLNYSYAQGTRTNNRAVWPCVGPRDYRRGSGRYLITPSACTNQFLVGKDVEYIQVGDVVSVPFNVACGRCTMCKEGKTGVCLNVNPSRPGGGMHLM